MSRDEIARLDGLSQRLTRARRELVQLRAEVDDLRASRSWRITSPLRMLAERFRGKGSVAPLPSRMVSPDPRIPAELLRTDLPDALSDDSLRLVDCTPHLAGLLSDEVIETLLCSSESQFPELDFRDARAGAIALISGATLATELAFDAAVFRLRPANATETLRSRSFAFLLLDMDLHDMETEWRQEMRGESEVLRSVIKECESLGIPVLVWLRCDAADYPHLKQWVLVADRVYAVDAMLYERALQDVGVAKLSLIGPAIQPRLHNPLKTDVLSALKPAGKFIAIYDALADFSKRPDPTEDRSSHACIWLMDSYWDVAANKGEAAQSGSHVVIGAVCSADKLVLSKMADAELFTATQVKPRWKLQKDMLNAAACGLLVVAEPSIAEAWPLQKVQPFASSLDDCVSLASKDDFGAAVWRRRVADEVLAGHTVLDALTKMRRDLDASVTMQTPVLSCLLVTRRPERVLEALENFRRQLHPRCELIVVLHGQSAPSVNLSAPGRRVVLLEAPMSIGLGDCLNLAASHALGEYWAKLDDDDYYAPEYLTRIHALLEMAAADVAGMPLVFTRFDSDGAVYCDPSKLALASRVTDGWRRGEICGATLAGTTDLLRRIPFRSDRRRGVDSQFLDDCSQEGVRIAVGDGFGFLCNRSSDLSQHTWEGDEAGVRTRGLRLNAEQQSSAGLPA